MPDSTFNTVTHSVTHSFVVQVQLTAIKAQFKFPSSCFCQLYSLCHSKPANEKSLLLTKHGDRVMLAEP